MVSGPDLEREMEAVVAFLESQKLLLITAESCTAGLMSGLLAAASGCGSVLEGGYVVYSPEAKRRRLGVSPRTIERYGLTSEEVAREMALGALEASGADIALANTGVADGQQAPDAGTQCFACALEWGGVRRVVSETVKFEGDRNQVRLAAARYGLQRLGGYFESLLAQS